jgi:tRNA U34 2-thiouridine synthase MnmA/TrmU
VVEVDATADTVTIGTRADLLRRTIALGGLCFVGPHPGCRAVTAQVSAHGRPLPGWLDGDVVHLDAPHPRVAPGQVVALYDGDELLGGGIAA